MDAFTTTVHLSRRPFQRCARTSSLYCPCPSPPPPHRPLPPTPSLMPLSSSTRKRKPTTTFRSPSCDYPIGIFIERDYSTTTPSTSPPPTVSSLHPYSSPPTSTTSPRASSRSSLEKLVTSASTQPSSTNKLTTTSIYALAPSLPLYHPLGKLALSLDPLDRFTFKELHQQSTENSIPQPPSIRSRQRNKPSGTRSRKPPIVQKLRDEDPVPYIEETSEIQTQRKRRTVVPSLFGTGAMPSKRKRKDADDPDRDAETSVFVPPQPPTKRSRNPPRMSGASPSPSLVLGEEAVIERDEEPKPRKRNRTVTGNSGRRNAGGGGRRGGSRKKDKDEDEELNRSIVAQDVIPSGSPMPSVHGDEILAAAPAALDESNVYERDEQTG